MVKEKRLKLKNVNKTMNVSFVWGNAMGKSNISITDQLSSRFSRSPFYHFFCSHIRTYLFLYICNTVHFDIIYNKTEPEGLRKQTDLMNDACKITREKDEIFISH